MRTEEQETKLVDLEKQNKEQQQEVESRAVSSDFATVLSSLDGKSHPVAWLRSALGRGLLRSAYATSGVLSGTCRDATLVSAQSESNIRWE